MEIYGIYQSFVLIFATAYGVSNIGGRNLFTALAIGGGVWLVLFILQGVGLYTMAKKRDMKNKWLAFVPFASVWYMGKLAGTCDVFGRKMKRSGLYVMLAQIIATLVCAAAIAVEILLFTKYKGRRGICAQFLLYQRLYHFYRSADLSGIALYPADGAV